jgi:hypothetical protein
VVWPPRNKEANVPKHEPLTVEELRVLTLREFANLNSISFQTAKRMFAEGRGPKTVQLSHRRVGVRVIDNRIWQESRIR